MEKLLALLIPLALGISALRLLLMPMKLVFKLLIHCFFGFACLWLLNLVAGITGVFFPVNLPTTLIAGMFGLPGIGLLLLLEWL